LVFWLQTQFPKKFGFGLPGQIFGLQHILAWHTFIGQGFQKFLRPLLKVKVVGKTTFIGFRKFWEKKPKLTWN